MKQICNPKECTGCSACTNVCGKQAIYMVADNYQFGHLFPQIDESKCVDCGLCQKTCPQLGGPVVNTPRKALASWAEDREVHRLSTSGGVAFTIARTIIEKYQGVVYACATIYEPELAIEHVRIDNLAELPKIQGSKYVQSHIGVDLFRKMKKDLKERRTVLFIGCPCQVAAAKQYSMGVNDKFYCIDIICHGVPSQKQLNEYLQTLTDEGIAKLSFRSTDDKSNSYGFATTTTTGTTISRKLGQSTYFSAFMRAMNYRESCYGCRYAQNNRVGDITIGDFWGLKDCDIPEDAKRLGVSVCLVNTDKGDSILSMVGEKLQFVERPIVEALKGNPQLNRPSRKNPLYDMFRTMYAKMGYKWSARICTIKERVHYSILVPLVTKLRK